MNEHIHLMNGLSVQHLQFTVQPTESIVLSAQPGTELRGALYQVLSTNFCSEPRGPQTPGHTERCPVCWLLAAEDHQSERGQDVPRPLTVEPPYKQHMFHPGDSLSFGYTLIGQAQALLPFVARAVQKMGQVGVGLGRGRFKLAQISEYSPLQAEARLLLESPPVIKNPRLQITPTAIETVAQQYTGAAYLEFITPLRLTRQKQLVKQLDPLTFMQRLLERVQSLAMRYAVSPIHPTREQWREHCLQLLQHAAEIEVVHDNTTWMEAWSGSRRQQRYLPLGGMVGTVQWHNIDPALIPWLLWGQSLHVGKNAVKGNGWYQVKPA